MGNLLIFSQNINVTKERKRNYNEKKMKRMRGVVEKIELKTHHGNVKDHRQLQYTFDLVSFHFPTCLKHQ